MIDDFLLSPGARLPHHNDRYVAIEYYVTPMTVGRPQRIMGMEREGFAWTGLGAVYHEIPIIGSSPLGITGL